VINRALWGIARSIDALTRLVSPFAFYFELNHHQVTDFHAAES
jgi:hypothetical protein